MQGSRPELREALVSVFSALVAAARRTPAADGTSNPMLPYKDDIKTAFSSCLATGPAGAIKYASEGT